MTSPHSKRTAVLVVGGLKSLYYEDWQRHGRSNAYHNERMSLNSGASSRFINKSKSNYLKSLDYYALMTDLGLPNNLLLSVHNIDALCSGGDAAATKVVDGRCLLLYFTTICPLVM